MQNRFASALVALTTVTFVATGCQDLTPLKTQALTAAKSLEPLLAAVGVSLDQLEPRIKALPTDLAGVTDLVAQLAKHKESFAATQKSVGELPAAIEAAFKGGKKEELMSLAARAAGELTKTIGTLSDEVGKTASAATTLEEAAKQRAALFMRKLATGFDLKGNLAGVEEQLVVFIEDANKAVDKTTWFNFDRLNFTAGSTELDQAASKEQLENMAEILKAFPNVKLKIGGYTDNTGPAAANKKLSLGRAESVVAALKALGVAPDRLAAEGYGPEHPACPANDTDECKAQNRRIALRVAAK